MDLDTGEDEFGTWLRFELDGVSQRMRWVPPGLSMLGSSGHNDKAHRYNETPSQLIEHKEGFWLGETACTQALWIAVMGDNPSAFTGDPSQPVESVSWVECVEFLTRLGARLPKLRPRLPTEAQWEHACRAGNIQVLDLPLDAIAWHAGNSDARPHPTGLKAANKWGLRDMLGNVGEWCLDGPSRYPAHDYSGYPPPPCGPLEGDERVLRGGSFSSREAGLRFARRDWQGLHYRSPSLGLRLARSAAPDATPETNPERAPALPPRVLTDPRPHAREDWAAPARSEEPEFLRGSPSGPSFGEDQFGAWLRFEVRGVAWRMRLVPAQAGSKAFWLGETACTQALWHALMPNNPSAFRGDPSRPVENVSFTGCVGFVAQLNAQVQGLHACLPSEAQWERAQRAGTQAERHGELDAVAWYRGNSGRQTHPVAGKLANAWGLHDMLGNVWQWCQTSEGSRQVIRGGSWYDSGDQIRASARRVHEPALRSSNLGFRLARPQEVMNKTP